MAKGDKLFLGYYDKFKDKIFNYFWYRLNFDRELAEDMTSEAFLKAFESFDRFEEGRPFQAWIYTIARNHLYNYYRMSGREVSLNEADNALSDPIAQIETTLDLEIVMGEIDKLDSYCRDVLLLRFSDGMDNCEIAEIMGKEEGAIRTQISRALNKLRNNLIDIYGPTD